MATAVQIRDAVDTEILARINSKAVNRYSLQDGRSIQRDSLGDLLKVRDHYAAAALDEERGTPLAIFEFFEG